MTEPVTRTKPAGYAFYAPDTPRLTVSTSSQRLDIQGADYALLVVEVDTIRFRVTGADPTSSAGIQATVGAQIELQSAEEIEQFRVIRDSSASTNAVLEISPARRDPNAPHY